MDGEEDEDVRRYSRTSRLNQELLSQAETLLRGGAADRYRRRGSRVPAWAQVNVLAHGSYADLARLAAGVGHRHPSSWDFAVSSLARDLLLLDLNGTALPDLQQAVLIPLELELLARSQAEPTSPAQFTRLVRGALDQHPIET